MERKLRNAGSPAVIPRPNNFRVKSANPPKWSDVAANRGADRISAMRHPVLLARRCRFLEAEGFHPLKGRAFRDARFPSAAPPPPPPPPPVDREIAKGQTATTSAPRLRLCPGPPREEKTASDVISEISNRACLLLASFHRVRF